MKKIKLKIFKFQGFIWTLEKIESKLSKEVNDDLLELWGLTKNYYAHLLMDCEEFANAKQYFTESYEIYTKIHGEINEEAIMMLNNLAVVCLQLNETNTAEELLKKAIEFAKKIPEMIGAGVLQANLGLVYLKRGTVEQAKNVCGLAWRIGKKYNDIDTLTQADYCLEEIKKFNASASKK